MLRNGFLILTAAVGLGLAACTPPEPTESPKLEAPEAEAPSATQVAASDAAAYRGAAFAAQGSSRCHDVGMGAPPAMEIGAPKFRDLAGQTDSTAESLAAKMRKSHPVMPDYIFGEAETADLAVYILSLRGAPG